jgi:hypothetical protein
MTTSNTAAAPSALTMDHIRKAIANMKEVRDDIPAGIVMAPDVVAGLGTECVYRNTGSWRNVPSFAGMPIRRHLNLGRGEWFIHDASGKVIHFNGSEARIRAVARIMFGV